MKDKLIAMICVLMMTVLIGCGKNAASADMDFSSGISPNVLECGVSGFNSVGAYFYTIDMNTGVVYLSYDSHYRHAITVMLNVDGTPITAEQLGIDYRGETNETN